MKILIAVLTLLIAGLAYAQTSGQLKIDSNSSGMWTTTELSPKAEVIDVPPEPERKVVQLDSAINGSLAPKGSYAKFYGNELWAVMPETCEDKRRVLLHSEDGAGHCILFSAVNQVTIQSTPSPGYWQWIPNPCPAGQTWCITSNPAITTFH